VIVTPWTAWSDARVTASGCEVPWRRREAGCDSGRQCPSDDRGFEISELAVRRILQSILSLRHGARPFRLHFDRAVAHVGPLSLVGRGVLGITVREFVDELTWIRGRAISLAANAETDDRSDVGPCKGRVRRRSIAWPMRPCSATCEHLLNINPLNRERPGQRVCA